MVLSCSIRFASRSPAFGFEILRGIQPRLYSSSSTASESNTKLSNVDLSNRLLARNTPIKTHSSFRIPFNKRKSFLFDKYERILAETPAILVVQHICLPSDQWTTFRRQLKIECHGAQAIVISSGIASAVVRGTKYENMANLFSGTVFGIYWDSIAASEQHSGSSEGAAGKFDPKISIKKILDLVKANPRLLILGGCVENSLLTPEMLVEYTNTPNIDQLQAEVVGLLQQPVSSLVRSLENIPSRLVDVLEQKSAQ
ncbi:hypothetical protein BB560_004083 [Smittium megazygosporum]|uniref:Ribosomal protein L10 n=1 Tax=Smittium megazygosporum TaxID=133381 RepID=A0A2T9ZA74_9FUNG|nr:hypothetical protein BB560_004083 [Smittium megazygosporum]